MTLKSWLKRLWKGHSRGVSTIIGTVFLMLIIFMVASNVLLWTFSQNAEYNEVVMARSQEEADRRDERVVASNGSYSVDGDKVTVEAELTNSGALASHVINLWVLDTTEQRYNNTGMSTSLRPGESETVSVVVTIPETDESHTFNSWFVTARGNTIPLEEENDEEEGTMWAQLAQGLGSLVLDFHSFRYYTYSGNTFQPWPDGNIGFYINTDLQVAYGALLTNRDPSKQTIALQSTSNICLIHRTGGGSGSFHWARWYIINVDNSTGTIASTSEGSYTPISLAYGETKLIIFASENDLEEGSFSKQSTPRDEQLCPVSLMVFGELGFEPYSQNIPFVSISFED
ncbi:MAG: hypothetical protein ACE5L6_06740 [Candidatus Bathyarchaeia archaeon]